jgi:hypothetical protein
VGSIAADINIKWRLVTRWRRWFKRERVWEVEQVAFIFPYGTMLYADPETDEIKLGSSDRGLVLTVYGSGSADDDPTVYYENISFSIPRSLQTPLYLMFDQARRILNQGWVRENNGQRVVAALICSILSGLRGSNTPPKYIGRWNNFTLDQFVGFARSLAQRG